MHKLDHREISKNEIVKMSYQTSLIEPASLSPEYESAEFYLDISQVVDIAENRRDAERAKGYIVLLNVSDKHLKLASVTDGQIIEFLFNGDQYRSKKVKDWLVQLSDDHQQKVVSFYHNVFKEIVAYHEVLNSSFWCIGCFRSEKMKMINNIRNLVDNSIGLHIAKS